MSKNILLTALLCLLGFVQASFAQETDNWSSFSKDHYSIRFPRDWNLDDSGQLGTNFFLFAPMDAKQDPFRENINLVSQSVAEFGVDLDGYVQLNFGQLRQLATNFHVLSMDKSKEGKNGEHYILTYTMDQGQYHLKLMQYYWIVNGQAYILTFTAEQATYNQYKTLAQQIIEGFVVEK
jgi:hypothetical protein